MNSKELSEMKEQIKKEILDLDHQINELETYYIEDTKESVGVGSLRETSSRGSRITSVPKLPAINRSPRSLKSRTIRDSSP